MMTSQQIRSCFEELNELLRSAGQKGEIGIVGGAAMCLVYNARAATRDVDAIFAPSALIRSFAEKIAETHGLPMDWLNDGAKAFLASGFSKEIVRQYSNLLVWAPEPRYLLAMKCLSARWDSADGDDVRFLVKHLQFTEASEVLILIKSYYPQSVIPAKTQFFVEELMEQRISGISGTPD